MLCGVDDAVEGFDGISIPACSDAGSFRSPRFLPELPPDPIVLKLRMLATNDLTLGKLNSLFKVGKQQAINAKPDSSIDQYRPSVSNTGE